MTDIAGYAPVRIALAGLGRVLIGAIPLAMAVLLAVVTSRMPAVPKSAADPPPWLFAAIGVFFLLVGLAIFSGGIARVGCAFARNCYLRADAQGMALRLPELGWLGRYRMRELSLPGATWRSWSISPIASAAFRPAASWRPLRNGNTIKLPPLFLRAADFLHRGSAARAHAKISTMIAAR